MFERHLQEKQRRFLTLEAPVQTSKELCFASPTEDALFGLPKAVKSSGLTTCTEFYPNSDRN